MESTSYEVLVQQDGKWRIHAQFPSGARDDAIEEAKALENMPGINGIKVVRDNYDERTGLHREHTVHKHTPAKPALATASSGAGGGAKYAHYMARAQSNRMMAFEESEQKVRKKSSGIGVVVKLLLVLLFSISVAAALTLFLNAVLPYKKISGIAFYGATRANLMIGIAIIIFLISVISSFRIFMGGDELDAPEFDLNEQRKRRLAEERRRALIKKRADEEKQARKEDKERTKEEQEELKKLTEEALKKKAEEEAKAAEVSSEEPAEDGEAEAEEAEAEVEPQLSPMAEKQKALLMGFFGDAIRSLPAERKKMDNYNRFGVNLYLAGAAEALGSERNLDAQSVTTILADALQLMGLKPEHADAFAQRYEEYLLQDARYMEMFQAGRNDLTGFIEGDKTTPANLDKSLHEWNKPKAPEDPEKEVVLMFTDIVGSTAMTHEKGNLAAQEVVRAHNRVVRDALSKTGGKEIKHTGDGIMASFENVPGSLLATQQMQLMIRMHNEQSPDVPLKVKIGINAGRVVMEENDLFGATVQMAARVVDKATADMILVTDAVYSLAQGGNWRFVKRGPYFLKGIEGPAYLQELIWDDKTDIDAIKAQVEAERPNLEQAYVNASGVALPVLAPEEAPATDEESAPQEGPQAADAATPSEPPQ